MIREWEILSQALQTCAFHARCIVRSRRQSGKKHLPLNYYISLYEESENHHDGNKMQLIDTIEPEQENDPEALYFGKEYTEAFVEQLKEMLSPLENHVLYLHLMGTDYKKIAEILEKSPKSVDNAIQRIRGKAEKMLRRHDR